MPFDAPPFSALLLAPLTLLPWKTAYFVWQLLSVLMMMASVYLALVISQDSPPPLMVVAVALALGFLFVPFVRALTYGNIDVVLLFLWVLGVYWLRRGHVISSAFCFALGTAVKISPVFAVPLFVMRRQWRWLAAYGVWSVLLLMASIWGAGWQNHLIWAGQVAPALSNGIKNFDNRSLAGFVLGICEPHGLFTKLPGPSGWCLFNKVLSGICYAAFLFWCGRERRGSQVLISEISLLPLIVLLVSPISWTQYWVLAVLPLAYLWSRARGRAAAASPLDLILLASSTLMIGAPLPEYRLALALGPVGEVLAMGTWAAATLALVGVGMRMYPSRVAYRRWVAPELDTRDQRPPEPVPVPSLAT